MAPMRMEPKKELNEFGAIAHHHRDALARAHAKPREHARYRVHAVIELRVGGEPLAAAEASD
jgi:hypothetical protein